MASLKRRLDLGLFISLVAFFGLMWPIVNTFVRAQTEGHVLARLTQDSEVLLAALNRTKPETPLSLDPERIDPAYKRPFSGRYFQIEFEDTVLRSRSLWDQSLSLASVPLGETLISRDSGPQGQSLLIHISTYQKQNQEITIAVADNLSEMESGIATFQRRYAILSAVILILLIFMQRKIVQGALEPLEQGRIEMTALERGEIKQLGDAVPDEIKPFVIEINRLIDHMRQALQRSRNATGNLAHALKAPLTLLRQLSTRDEIKKYPELQSALDKQLLHLQALLTRELKRARLAGPGQPGKRLSIAAEVDDLFEVLQKIYREKNLSFGHDIPEDTRWAIDREDFLELMGNLLDNASKWAKHRVQIHIAQTDAMGAQDLRLEIKIEDDGPGAPPDSLEKLSERGTRLDESQEGHGLGLSIAKDIVSQYSGEIDFGKSEQLGGMKVSVRLTTKERNPNS